MTTHAGRLAVIIIAAGIVTGCSGRPDNDSLKDSFAQQLAANKFVKDFQRNGDDLTFTAPGADGGTAKWRVHYDTVTIEDTESEGHPYKGIVLSSWYSDNRIVKPRLRESNLPIELTSNGLAQECFAFWEAQGKRWDWEE